MSRPDHLTPALLSLAIDLPPGRPVRGREGADEQPTMWVSDEPATLELWRALIAERARSGLSPLLLESFHLDPRRPWDDGELWPGDMSSPGDHDPAELLALWWAFLTKDDQDVTVPYGRDWPGLADGKQPPVDPDEHADRCAEELLRDRPLLRLGLVAAGRSSDALTVAGWSGPINHAGDTAQISAVLRSWEERFGVRVIAAGFADLHLSVAAPPVNQAEAIRVAAEHFAFCPDNIWQYGGALPAYARNLIGVTSWRFWWD